ncbi:NB-ARC domain-containing protein, partial [Nonomuraea angiospora]
RFRRHHLDRSSISSTRSPQPRLLIRLLKQALVVAAVHGLGGVGKSTLAARCAIRWSARAGGPHPVWWITADSASAVQAGLAGLATALQPELSEALPLEALAERAVAWLAAHRGWLLVLDNVTDPADVAMLLARRLKGRIVVTSRLAEGWHRYGAHLLRLDVLTEPQAVELLLRIADHLDADDGEAADLCRELGYLPLAVEQAAAYLHQTRLTPARYLEFLRDNPAVMYDQTARGSDAMRTIARIWRITLDSLADTPLAGHLLRTLAWWAPEAIPRTLLDPANPAKVTTALGALAAYNLVVLDADTVTVHRLVQAVARTPDPGDPHRRPTDIDFARYLATGLLNQARPHDAEDPARWPIWRALLPHIEALSDHTDPASDILVSADLLSWTARFLLSQEDVHRARVCTVTGVTPDQGERT